MLRDAQDPLRIVWVYPDLLSTYGDQGNAIVLARRARLRGLRAEVESLRSDRPVPVGADIYLLGGGEDRPQVLAARRLRADGGLAQAVAAGAVVFAVCAGYQLMGTEFTGEEEERVSGLGLIDVASQRAERRAVGEIACELVPEIAGRAVDTWRPWDDPALWAERDDRDPETGPPTAAAWCLTGFENHRSLTRRGPGVRPLARTLTGVGNGDGTEGAYYGRIIGTYLHGPVLARNPALADLLLTWAVGRTLPPLTSWADRLHEERLGAVLGRSDHRAGRTRRRSRAGSGA